MCFMTETRRFIPYHSPRTGTHHVVAMRRPIGQRTIAVRLDQATAHLLATDLNNALRAKDYGLIRELIRGVTPSDCITVAGRRCQADAKAMQHATNYGATATGRVTQGQPVPQNIKPPVAAMADAKTQLFLKVAKTLGYDQEDLLYADPKFIETMRELVDAHTDIMNKATAAPEQATAEPAPVPQGEQPLDRWDLLAGRTKRRFEAKTKKPWVPDVPRDDIDLMAEVRKAAEGNH